MRTDFYNSEGYHDTTAGAAIAAVTREEKKKRMATVNKVKEFLGQAYRFDQRINSKIEQVASLHDLATKATSTVSDMPRSATPNTHRMEDVVVKIIMLENEINADIDELVDLKAEIVTLIKKVSNPEYQTLLELRYLSFKTWEQTAVEMGYSIQHMFRLHDKALKEIAPFMNLES